jgi:hypothetical protein
VRFRSWVEQLTAQSVKKEMTTTHLTLLTSAMIACKARPNTGNDGCIPLGQGRNLGSFMRDEASRGRFLRLSYMSSQP